MKINIRKAITPLLVIIFGAVMTLPATAASTYTVAEVAEHNSSSDCWMIYDNSVYDLTDYLDQHDRYMDITSYCGSDMTEAFETKAGTGRDHKSSSYDLLENYKIGELSASSSTTSTNSSTTNSTTSTNSTTETEEETNTSNNPYNFWTPFLLSIILYVSTYYFSTSNLGKKYLSRAQFNSIWNSVLVISLIPSGLFGLFMIWQYSSPSLANINFDFLYWHVEGSIVFTSIVLAHIILRLPQYFTQVKSIFKAK